MAGVHTDLPCGGSSPVAGRYESDSERQNGGSSAETIASAFAALHDARQDADCNTEPFRLNRGDTTKLSAIATRAVDMLGLLGPEVKLELAVMLVVKGRSGVDQQP